MLRFHCCIYWNRAPAKPETHLVREFFPTSVAQVPVRISAIAPSGFNEHPTPRSIFSAAEDSLERRVTRSAALLSNLASSCQACFDLHPGACDLPWRCDHDYPATRFQGSHGERGDRSSGFLIVCPKCSSGITSGRRRLLQALNKFVTCRPFSAIPRRRVFENADHSGADRTLDRAGAARK